MSIDFFKKSQGWFTKGVLLLLAAAFVFGFGYVGGISLGGGGTTGGTAVKVNGDKIPLARFYFVRDGLNRQFGGSEMPPEAQDFIKYRALQQIVEAKLLAQEADKLGFKVTDEELSEAIRTNPSFQQDGKFIGLDSYKELIRRGLNLTVAQFETSFKDELLIRKLIDMINESAKITDEELLNLYKIESEQVNLNYLEFSPSEFSKSVIVSDEEINEFYEKNKDKLLSSEKRKSKYLKISKDDLKEKTVISDSEVQIYYDSYKDEFPDSSGNIKPLSEAKEEIIEKLKSQRVNTLFNQFTEKYSSDSDAMLDKIATESGFADIQETDLIASSDIVDLPAQVKNRIFNLEKNKVSLVRDGELLWLIQLQDVLAPKSLSVDKARDQIVERLKNEKGKNAAKIAADETLKKIKTSGNFRNEALLAGLKVKETSLFSRLKPPASPKIDNINIEAFLLEKNNPTSDKVFESNENFYLISLKEKVGVDVNEFENKKDDLKQRELRKQRRELLSGWIRKLHKEAKIVPNKQLFPTG